MKKEMQNDQSVFFEIEPIYGRCSKCGGEMHVLDLHFLPETEKTYRKFALKQIEADEPSSLNLNTNMFCEECLGKAIAELNK